MGVTPDYAGPEVAPPSPSASLYRAALVFALAPQLAAVLALVLYYLTEWGALIPTGVATIAAGSLSVVLAVVLALIYRADGGRGTYDDATASLVRTRAKRVIRLAAANVPVGLLCAIGGAWYAAELPLYHTFVVTNVGKTPVTSSVINGPGVRVDLSPVGPGATLRRRIKISRTGQIMCDVAVGGEHFVCIVDRGVNDLVTPGTHQIVVTDYEVSTAPW